ncbi:MAG: replicative DNA helicase [Synergistaceae bacterium]|nr:replicative DNA helicase [Synergistaceae bacterium]
MDYRQPQPLPSSREAERSVIGACMISKEALDSAIEILRPDDFFDPACRVIFNTLSAIYLADKPADLVTVSDELKAQGEYDRLGGMVFLAGLMSSVATTANVITHAEIIRDYAVRRRLIDAGNRIVALAYQADKSVKEITEEAEKLISEAANNKSSDDVRHVREIIGPVFVDVEERMKRNGSNLTGFETGFADLDAFTGGLQPGSLTIIAARPSMGKTAFAVNIAQFGGGRGNNIPVLIFSLEMPAEQLVLRMLAAESMVNLSALTAGTFDTDSYKRVKEACAVLAKRDIYISDTSELSAIDFRTRCRRFKTHHPDLGLVIVDYLQLMSSGEKRGSEGRQQEVSDISRMLKATARELECPVIALSQLSRAAENRTEKKPQLSDLRDSGAIEQDADVVLLMFREDYYSENENNDLTNSQADIRVAKNRNGGTGIFHLTFEREFTRFRNHGEEF